MKYIKPPEISGKIMSLIDEADERVVIISPYNELGNWEKMKRRIKKAQSRKISIEYYIRANVPKGYNSVKQLGIEPIEVENLHAKVYFNEKAGIVTSMNMTQTSDIGSIDIGFETENDEELKKIVEFYSRYIKAKTRVKTDSRFEDSARLKTKDTDDVLERFLEMLKSTYREAEFQRDGVGIYCQKFLVDNLFLGLTSKGAPFRIEFRLQHEYKQRKIIYDLLKVKSVSLCKN